MATPLVRPPWTDTVADYRSVVRRNWPRKRGGRRRAECRRRRQGCRPPSSTLSGATPRGRSRLPGHTDLPASTSSTDQRSQSLIPGAKGRSSSGAQVRVACHPQMKFQMNPSQFTKPQFRSLQGVHMVQAGLLPGHTKHGQHQHPSGWYSKTPIGCEYQPLVAISALVGSRQLDRRVRRVAG